MLGAIILALVIVVAIPVSVILTGAVVAALMGTSLTKDGKARHEGSELIDLNT